MENRTEAISSVGINFQLVSNRLGTKSSEKRVRQKPDQESISDSLETSDSDSHDSVSRLADTGENSGTGRSPDEGTDTGSILDISI